jgi:hypothetical protein
VYCVGVVEEEEGAACSVNVTGIPAPGRPMVVSRTWHVIGGFAGPSAMVCAGGDAGTDAGVRCAAMADRRCGAARMY